MFSSWARACRPSASGVRTGTPVQHSPDVFRDYGAGFLLRLPLPPALLQLSPEGVLRIPQQGGLFKILGAYCGVQLLLCLCDLLLQLPQGRGEGGVLQPGPGGGFIHQVDRFVREKAGGQIALG